MKKTYFKLVGFNVNTLDFILKSFPNMAVTDTPDSSTLFITSDLEKINDKNINNLIISEQEALPTFIKKFDLLGTTEVKSDYKSIFNLKNTSLNVIRASMTERLASSFKDTKSILLEELNLITDELITNAFYNAPINNKDVHIYKEADRTGDISLEKEVEIEVMSEKNCTVIRCKDYFGTLFPEQVIEGLSKQNNKEATKTVSFAFKGAGIGLSLLYNYSDIIIFNLSYSKFSEVTCIKYDRKNEKKRVIIKGENYPMSSYTLSQKDKTLIIRLGANIDEEFDSKKISHSEFQDVIVDFDKVNKINSCGIREWIAFLNTLGDKKVTYINCKKVIVDQMNMIYGFINKNVFVESFYLPYYCDKCDIEESKLMTIPQLIKLGGEPPEAICSKCNKKMVFDEVNSQYLNFIKKMMPR